MANGFSARAPRILMTAGEVSGDRQAAHLARAILSQRPDALLYGTGGDMMRDAGVDIRIAATRYGTVGFQESLRFVRPLRHILVGLRSIVRADPPDVAVLVDNEGFNGIVGRFLHEQGIPFINYFPPQVWLWGEWRARAIARRASLIVAAFPQEAEIFRREGGEVRWFGHPLLDIVGREEDPAADFRACGLDPGLRTIGLMPGSRVQELERLLPVLLGAARILSAHDPALQFVLPVAAGHLRAAVESRLGGADIRLISSHVYGVLKSCAAVLLSSGTATLELALLGTPMVVGYRVSPVSYVIGKQVVKAKFIAMPNILAGKQIVPELIQGEATSERFAYEAMNILNDPQRASGMRRDLASIVPLLGQPGALQQTARVVLRHAERAIAARRQAV